MSLFEIVHKTSYCTLIETMHLSCTVSYSKLFVEDGGFYLCHLHLVPIWGAKIFGNSKLESLDYRAALSA